jgi:hypothetical protein
MFTPFNVHEYNSGNFRLFSPYFSAVFNNEMFRKEIYEIFSISAITSHTHYITLQSEVLDHHSKHSEYRNKGSHRSAVNLNKAYDTHY